MNQPMSTLQRAIQAEFPLEYAYTNWLDLVPQFVRLLAGRYMDAFQDYRQRHRHWLQEGDWSEQPRYPLPPAELLEAAEVLYKLYAEGSDRHDLMVPLLRQFSFEMKWVISVSDQPLEPLHTIEVIDRGEQPRRELDQLKKTFANAHLSLNQPN